MKKLLLISLLFITGVKAQTTSQRLAALEKQQTIFKSEHVWFKSEKKKDSLTILQLKANIKVLTDSLNKFRPTYFSPPLFVNAGAKMDSVFLIIPKQ